MSQLLFTDTWLDLEREPQPLNTSVTVTDSTVAALQGFDYKTDGTSTFTPWRKPADLPTEFALGVIVGASGTGKSTLLEQFGTTVVPHWQQQLPIVEQIPNAVERLYAVGLSSIPTWVKPYHVLSTGERFRADLAKQLDDGAVIDEYTSVVDRTVAIAASTSLRRYIDDQHISNVVIATCHRDVIPHLRPDWIIDTSAGMYVLNPRECLQHEPVAFDVYEVAPALWARFSRYHYLTGDLSPFASCYAAFVNGEPAAFYAVISYPSGTVRDAFRGHRLVTHPDYQGLGIGPRLADYVAEQYVLAGKRFFAKTAHPRLGEYRERHPNWKPTSKNRRKRTDAGSGSRGAARFESWQLDPDREVYSHEYVLGAK